MGATASQQQQQQHPCEEASLMMMMDESSSSSGSGGGTAVVLQLTPAQSCSLHGWTNPKRTLSWQDVARNPRITLKRCMEEGLTQQQLHELQPDLQQWIARKQVLFCC